MPNEKAETHLATPWVNVLSKPFEGSTEPYYYLDLPDYVSILAVTKDNKVLTVQQHRVPVNITTKELPSGLLEKDESPEDCAIRECREETGYAPSNLILLNQGFIDPGRLNNKFHCFFSNDLKWDPLPRPEINLTCHLVSFESYQNSLLNENTNSALNTMTWLLAKEKKLI